MTAHYIEDIQICAFRDKYIHNCTFIAEKTGIYTWLLPYALFKETQYTKPSTVRLPIRRQIYLVLNKNTRWKRNGLAGTGLAKAPRNGTVAPTLGPQKRTGPVLAAVGIGPARQE